MRSRSGSPAISAGAHGGTSLRSFALLVGGLCLFFAVAASLFFQRYPLPRRHEVALYGCLIVLLFLAALPALPLGRRFAHRWRRRRWAPLLILFVWVVPYWIYAAGTGDFRLAALYRLLAVCAPPLSIYYVVPRRHPGLLYWADAFAWLWLTLAVVLRRLAGIWTVPVNLDFMARLFVIAVASWCWVFVRPVPGMGYAFSVSARIVRAAAFNFAGFALIAIPAAFAMRFAGWHPRWQGFAAFCLNYVEILVFIAWLEELLFRGFLQSLATRWLQSEIRGQLVASLAFGLSHVLLAPAPNWRYVALASVAGWFYGSAFRRSRNLVGPSLTHALVDVVWRTWFTPA
ncbi:MAG TPA: CPBP family intramembrane glutamic endopeptidase [Bryobacteraceae bacterium]|nr:CPBP family intramembrane glutamic endopeptidase [Bryobacteraceae bacterium]